MTFTKTKAQLQTDWQLPLGQKLLHHLLFSLGFCFWSGKSLLGFPEGTVVKNLLANAGDAGLIPGLGRSPGGENGNLLQYSCLENTIDRGARWATVHRVTQCQTWLSDRAHTHTQCYIIFSSLHSLRFFKIMFQRFFVVFIKSLSE